MIYCRFVAGLFCILLACMLDAVAEMLIRVGHGVSHFGEWLHGPADWLMGLWLGCDSAMFED